MEEYEEILKIIISVISLIGSLFIIFTIALIKDLWTFHFRLILYLAISNCFISIALVLPNQSSELACKLQGFFDTIGSLSSLIWTAFIMFGLYRLIINEVICSIRLEFFFIVFCWTLTLSISIVGYNYYENLNVWCWVKDNFVIIFLCFYAEYFIVVLFDIYVYIRIWLYIRSSEDSPEMKKLKKKALRRFIWYPIILIICYTPSTLFAFFPEDNSAILLLRLLGNCLYGLACTAAYCNTKNVRNKIFRVFSNKKNIGKSLISITDY